MGGEKIMHITKYSYIYILGPLTVLLYSSIPMTEEYYWFSKANLFFIEK